MTIILYPDEMQVFGMLQGVHEPGECGAEICIIHNPINGAFRLLPLLWRNDVKLFERVCEHAVGHPDPSQFAFWRATGQDYKATHGCDRCCMDWEIESWMFD